MRINFERLVVELVCSSLITLPFPLHLFIVWFIISGLEMACLVGGTITTGRTWAISVRARAANQACVHHHQLSAEWLDHQTSRLDRCVCVFSFLCNIMCSSEHHRRRSVYSSSVQASHTDEPNHHDDVTPSCANLAWYCPRLDGRLDSQHIVS